MKLSAIILDDEPLAISNTLGHLKDLTFIEVVATTDNLKDAEKEILFHKPDLLFLDIEIHNEPVFNLLENLEKRNLNFGIVFITGHPDKYISQAIESCGLKYKFDYLKKPIYSKKLIDTLNNFRKKTMKDNEDVFIIKQQNGFTKLFYDEIFFAETDINNCILHTNDGKRIVLSNKNLSWLEENLPRESFFRMSKQHLINRTYFRNANREKDKKYYCYLKIGTRLEKLLIPEKKWPNFKNAFKELFIS